MNGHFVGEDIQIVPCGLIILTISISARYGHLIAMNNISAGLVDSRATGQGGEEADGEEAEIKRAQYGASHCRAVHIFIGIARR